MKYLLLVFFLYALPLYVDSQELTCKVDTILDISNKVEYKFKNDTTVVVTVTINSNSIQAEYYYLQDSEYCKFIPDFILKYRNSFIFLNGIHQHYRLLTLFQLEGNKIVVNKFENELMLESSNDGFEKIFFLYKGQPVIVLIDNKNRAFIKLSKKHYSIKSKDIESITVEGKRAIVNFKNNKKKIITFKYFR